eukprot:m.440932 g.440932  ORF g.440932 m.440932 type:complete len:385 (-) comp18591_c0_seq1:85-1239(-)
MTSMRWTAAVAVAAAAAGRTAAQRGTGVPPLSQWNSQWFTSNCTGSTVGAACADLANFTLTTNAAGETYFWAPHLATGGHSGCAVQATTSGTRPRGCGLATLNIYCERPAYVRFSGEGQAGSAAFRGNDDSFWTFVDNTYPPFYQTTGWVAPPRWNYQALVGGATTFFAAGPHALNVAEREDGTRMRRLSITAGYPDCHFGAPPPANTSADALLTRVLALETATNNRVSAVSTLVASVSSAAAANNASIMAAVSQATTVSTMTGSVSSMTASLSSAVSNAQSQVRVQSTLQATMSGTLSTAGSTATAVSSALASLTSRFGGVSNFNVGVASALPGSPVVASANQDLTLTAASGGTVRVSGGQCQADLCGLVGQVSQLTAALRQT